MRKLHLMSLMLLLSANAYANPYHSRIVELNPDIRAAEAINNYSCLEVSDAVAGLSRTGQKDEIMARFFDAILNDLYLTKADLEVITGHPTFWLWYNAEFQQLAGCKDGLSSFSSIDLPRRLEVSMLSPAFGEQASLSIYACALSMGYDENEAALAGVRALNRDMEKYGKSYEDFVDWPDGKKYSDLRHRNHPKYGISFNRYYIRSGLHETSCDTKMKTAITNIL